MKNAKKTALGVSIVMASMFGLTGVAMADTNTTVSGSTNTSSTDGSASVSGTNSASTSTATAAGTSGTSGTTNISGTASTSPSTGTSTTSSTSTTSPSSYLYFVQQVTQAVTVALANDSVQRAELLAQYGQNEITEANNLMQAGQADAANQLLNDAAANQLIAASSTSGSTTTSSDSTSGSSSATDTTQGGTAQDGTTQGGTSVSQVNMKIANNITALAEALQHVQNPNAQAALERNIAKAFSHLQHRLTVIGKHGKHEWTLPAGLNLNVSGSTTGSTQNTSGSSDNSTSTNVSGNATGGESTSGSNATASGSSNTNGVGDFAMRALDDGKHTVQQKKSQTSHGRFESNSKGTLGVTIGRGNH